MFYLCTSNRSQKWQITQMNTVSGTIVTCLIVALYLPHFAECATAYTMSFSGGIFYGPGKMPDSPMPEGKIEYLELDMSLSGVTPYFNNGREPPGIEPVRRVGGFPEEGTTAAGRMSNGEPFNEYMNGGVVEVGKGALKLLNIVPRSGPNNGEQHYRLDAELNWEIITDLALDPGFAQGLLIAENLRITTGTVWVPFSLQSQMGLPNGVDFAGSRPSGAAIVGRLGDFNLDGYLDGIIVGQASIPLGHIFYPGAPVAQLRHFSSDIPISAYDASVLVLAGILNYRAIWNTFTSAEPASGARLRYFRLAAPGYLADIQFRLSNLLKLFDKLSDAGRSVPEVLRMAATSLYGDISLLQSQYTTVSPSTGRLCSSDKDPVIDFLKKTESLFETMRSELSFGAANAIKEQHDQGDYQHIY